MAASGELERQTRRTAAARKEPSKSSDQRQQQPLQVDIWERLAEGVNAFDREWRFIYVNRAAEELLGWSREELLGRTLWDVYPMLLGARPHREYFRAMEEQVSAVFDEFHEETGRWFEFRAHPATDGLHVYFRDVTAQRRRVLDENVLSAAVSGAAAGQGGRGGSAGPLSATLGHLIALAENAPDRIARFDRSGRFLYANPAFCRAVDLPLDSFRGRRYDERIRFRSATDRERWGAALRRVVESGEAAVFFTDEPSGGERPRTFEVRLVPEYEAAGEGAASVASVLAIARDVTERAQADADLRRSEERYRALVSATAQLVWTCGQNGECHEPSLTWEAFTGQTAEEMLGYGYQKAIHPDDMPMVLRIWNHAAETGLPYRAEHRLRRRDGVWRQVVSRAIPLRDAETGAVREWVGTCADVTDQREAEASVRESEERYEAISSMTSDYAFSYRLEEDGRLQLEWITDAFTDVSGYSPEDLKRLGWEGVLHPDDVVRVETMMRRVVLSYGAEANMEARIRTRDGEIRWLRLYARPRLDSGRSAIVGLYGAAQDITKQKHAEAEMLAAHQKQRRIAETLQRSLLITPPEGAFPGLDIHTEYEPAWDEAAVGGDFHDVFAVDAPHRVAVVVGDVMGKGLAAAAYTAEVKFALRAFLREYRRPGLALEKLNDFIVLSQELDPDAATALVCVVLALIDTRTGETEISAAGAEMPIVLGPDLALPDPSCHVADGPLLGVSRGMEYGSHTTRLGQGDVLLLFTDGLTEARAAGSGTRFFGTSGIAAAAVAAAERSSPNETENGGGGSDAAATLQDIGQAIVQAARTFSRDGNLLDDACLLLVRRTPAE